MSETQAVTVYKMYWKTWGFLLVLTSIMLFAEALSMPKALVVTILILIMLVKAGLIGGQFMHLRFEKPGLAFMVAGCILFFGAFLFVVISFDGMRIWKMVQP